jgi:hypothetical protein
MAENAVVNATPTAATTSQVRPRTPKQTEADETAFNEFREILKKLIEGDQQGQKPGSPSTSTESTPQLVGVAQQGQKPGLANLLNDSGSKRGLIVWFNRYLNRVPEFEDLLAKYTKILPALDTDDGRPYSEMALNGINALRKRKLQIAKTVYSEVLFKTTAPANLGSALLGVVTGIGCLFLLGTILVAVAQRWLGIDVKALINNTDATHTDAIHLFVAFLFGCVGSVVSFLGRLSEFDSKQVRSQRFILTYCLTLPIIGGGFALVLAAALDSKIITIFPLSGQLFIVIGFLAGFSERFTKNFLDLFSKIVPPAPPPPIAPPAPPPAIAPPAPSPPA